MTYANGDWQDDKRHGKGILFMVCLLSLFHVGEAMGNWQNVYVPTDDNRSYHINSDKVYRVLGFRPKYSIEDAVRGLCAAFRQGKIPGSFTDDSYYNIRTMKKLHVQ